MVNKTKPRYYVKYQELGTEIFGSPKISKNDIHTGRSKWISHAAHAKFVTWYAFNFAIVFYDDIFLKIPAAAIGTIET